MSDGEWVLVGIVALAAVYWARSLEQRWWRLLRRLKRRWERRRRWIG